MSLNNTTADALATAITTALGVTEATGLAQWKTICEQIYSHLKTDITITISTNTIVTTGSAATQTGPTTPVSISPA